jgi:hypothetical protein
VWQEDAMPGACLQCVAWSLALAMGARAPKASRPVDKIEPFDADQHVVATYYYNWYVDGSGYKYGSPAAREHTQWAWEPCYPKADEAGAEIFGLNDPTVWPTRRLPNTSKWPDSDDWLYHIAELRAMKWAAIDFVFVDLWWPNDFVKEDAPPGAEDKSAPAKGKDKPRGASRKSGGGAGGGARVNVKAKKGSPSAELSALFRAWKYLDQRGEEPVKLSIILESPSYWKADVRGAPAGQPDMLFEPIWAFYRQFLGDNDYPAIMPRRALAAYGGKNRKTRLIVDLFYPRSGDKDKGEWISRWDIKTFRDLRSRFEGMVGLPLYICVNQHLHGPQYGGWDGVQADGSIVEISRHAGVVDQEITWHASLAGPRTREDSISIGAGYFKPSGGEKRPGGDAKLHDGSVAYPRAYRYIKEQDKISSYEAQWQEVLNSPEGFKKHLLVIESWNELIEGTQLAPAKPAIVKDAQGGYVDRWGETPTQYIELTRKYAAMWRGRTPPPAISAGKPAPKPADSAASKPARAKRRARRR